MRFFGNSRISARKVTLLPEPDSPSRPSTSPSPSDQAEIVDGMHGALAGKANVEVLDFDEIGHAAFGTRSWKSVARWNAAPIRNNIASSNDRPISCMPTGSPLSVKPEGIESDGKPR